MDVFVSKEKVLKPRNLNAKQCGHKKNSGSLVSVIGNYVYTCNSNLKTLLATRATHFTVCENRKEGGLMIKMTSYFQRQ